MKKAIVVLPISDGERSEYEKIPGFEFSFKELKDISPEEFQGVDLITGNITASGLNSLASVGVKEKTEPEKSFFQADPGVARIINQPLVLASASPRRRELLKKADIPFTVMPADIEEVSVAGEPADMAEEISSYKAEYVAEKLIREKKQDSFVILSADTIVTVDGKVLGKPKDEEDAFNVLKTLQGREHEVYTGVTIAVKHPGKNVHYKQFHEKTRVKIYPVSDEQIRDYISTGEPLDKAGSYAIQGSFAKYIKSIKGDYSNVVGLPVGRVFKELKQFLKK
ncbi:MAG: Maf family protein [Lachnospiraceae bacterium]|nr:Maf family protein [Lachnospiraceae bacterium]